MVQPRSISNIILPTNKTSVIKCVDCDLRSKFKFELRQFIGAYFLENVVNTMELPEFQPPRLHLML